MKAQISFVEYIVAFSIFITFVAYIFFRLLNLTPTYLEEIKNELIVSEAYQISELLINDYGKPINWNSRNVERIGLSDHSRNRTNFLSVDKINELKTLCDIGNFDKVRASLDVYKEYQFKIILSDKLKKFFQDVIVCQPSEMIPSRTVKKIKRFVAFTDGVDVSYGELIVQVW